jgi:hypothetical protein
MKRNKLIIYLVLVTSSVLAQISTDTVKSSWYCRSMPVSLYTGAGLMVDKVASNIEMGRSFGVIDVGLAIGQMNQRADSNKYGEIRVNMDVSQYSIYSSEVTVGIGKVFNSRTPIMLEISYTIFAQIYKKWGLGIVTGYYDFSGNTSDASKTFYGVFIRYGLLRDVNGILRKSKTHHRR